MTERNRRAMKKVMVFFFFVPLPRYTAVSRTYKSCLQFSVASEVHVIENTMYCTYSTRTRLENNWRLESDRQTKMELVPRRRYKF